MKRRLLIILLGIVFAIVLSACGETNTVAIVDPEVASNEMNTDTDEVESVDVESEEKDDSNDDDIADAVTDEQDDSNVESDLADVEGSEIVAGTKENSETPALDKTKTSANRKNTISVTKYDENGKTITTTKNVIGTGKKAGVTPIDPSIGNYHGYDGSPPADYDDSWYFGIDSYTGYKHLTWTSSEGVVLWVVDSFETDYANTDASYWEGDIYDIPDAQPGTKEYRAVVEFLNDYLTKEELNSWGNGDVSSLPQTSVAPSFGTMDNVVSRLATEEFQAYNRELGKVLCNEIGQDGANAIFRVTWAENGEYIYLQSGPGTRQWAMRWVPEYNAWQVQFFGGDSAGSWDAFKTVLKTVVVGSNYQECYNCIYNSIYGLPGDGKFVTTDGSMTLFNDIVYYNGFNISRENIPELNEYGQVNYYVEFWIGPN